MSHLKLEYKIKGNFCGDLDHCKRNYFQDQFQISYLIEILKVKLKGIRIMFTVFGIVFLMIQLIILTLKINLLTSCRLSLSNNLNSVLKKNQIKYLNQMVSIIFSCFCFSILLKSFLKSAKLLKQTTIANFAVSLTFVVCLLDRCLAFISGRVSLILVC